MCSPLVQIEEDKYTCVPFCSINIELYTILLFHSFLSDDIENKCQIRV